MTTPSPLSPVVGEAQASPVERFRKKPLEVAAIRYTGSNPEAVARFAGEGYTFGSLTGALVLHAPAAEIYIHDGDWVVRTDHGIRAYAADVFAEQFDPAPEPLELTPVEQAAAETDLHFTTCKVRNFDCSQCAPVLSAVPRYVKAARLVIAEEFERIADAQMAAANDEGYRRGYREALSEQAHAVRDLVDALQLTVEYVGTDVLKPLPGWSWYDALRKHAPNVADYLEHGLAPVAAALDPTPIPDGEQR